MSVIKQKSMGGSGARAAYLLFCVFMLYAGAAFGGGYGTKFILHGWDLGNTTPENVLAHADQLNKLPIAGVTVRLADVKQADGSTICAETLPTDIAWRRESVEPLLPVYREIAKRENLKHTFISCSIVPRGTRFDWRDDAEWARIAGNLKVLAHAAKAGGLKGLCIDNEDYTGSKQFLFLAADGSYDDTVALVRKRGAQLLKAVFEEYPDITLLWFWAFSNARLQSAADDPVAALKESGRLLPAFLNGMLDVIPPEAVFVDGNEDAYSFETSCGDFNKAAVQILSHVLTYVAPENRAKYRAQVRNSYGLYLNEFTCGKYRTSDKRRGQPNHWYRGPVNGSRAEHFREILEGAVYAADEYVWFYGESYSYINWGDTLKPKPWAQFSTTETWDDMIGFSAKLEMAKDPDGYARKCLKKFRVDPNAVNLLADVNGVDVKGAKCTSFITHKQMTNRNNFVVSAELKGEDAGAILRWQKDLNWNWEPGGVRKVELKPEGPSDAEGWTRFYALVRVPVDGNRFHLQITGLSHNVSRNVSLYRVDPPPERPYALAYQLDISRCKVPQMPELFRIVDILSALGYNQFQLYMECAFAYEKHEKAWEGRSPVTAAEIRALADYCTQKGIDLVPSQNSFAHMGPWMKIPEYRKLAECPNGVDIPKPRKKRGPVTLCATSGESLKFLEGLYDELLPNFKSKYFNVGCDEVLDIRLR